MPETSAPFIQLGEDGDDAPRLNYSVPESTNHVGLSVISVDIDQGDLNAETLEQLRLNAEEKKTHRPRPVPPDLRIDDITLVQKGRRRATVNNLKAVTEVYERNASNFIYAPVEGMLGFTGDFDIIQPRPRPPERVFPKILFFEKLQISTYLGNYGAGRVIKTFSLFPGEKTKISVKTYQKTKQKEETTVNFGSSVLDSVTEEAATDFENSIQTESSNKYTESEADILNSQKNFEQGRFRRGQGALGIGGGERQRRVGAVERDQRGVGHTLGAGKLCRDGVERAFQALRAGILQTRCGDQHLVRTKQHVSFRTGIGANLERQIENVNVSRTLNLVFRQMVQEYISVLHLTDVKIALYDESPGPYPQYSMHELDKFLDANFADDNEVRTRILEGIIRELFFIFDYQDEPQQFLEQVNLAFPQSTIEVAGLDISLPRSIGYLRVNKSLRTRLADREFIEVPGVVLKENVITMRTEGVVVDGFLGRGGDPVAGLLDSYSAALQTQTIRDMELKNAMTQEEIDRSALGRAVVEASDGQQARLFRKVFCCEADKPNTPQDEDGGDDDA